MPPPPVRTEKRLLETTAATAVILPACFHWSPADRYTDINRHGLVAGSRSTVASTEIHQVCVSPDPALAWQLSGAMEWASEIEVWDLWQVRLAETDEILIRAEFGPRIWEVKIRNSVPRDRLWYVGRRHEGAAINPA